MKRNSVVASEVVYVSEAGFMVLSFALGWIAGLLT